MDVIKKFFEIRLPAGVIRREACRDHEVAEAGSALVHNSAVASDDEDSCDEVRPVASTAVAACVAMSEVDFEFYDSAV
jgi:hypothetical protein